MRLFVRIRGTKTPHCDIRGSPVVITSSEVRDRPLQVITDRCTPMRTNPYLPPPSPAIPSSAGISHEC